MFLFVELTRDHEVPLFSSDDDRRAFMGRARRLGERWDVRVLAFRLLTDRAQLVLSGERRPLGQWCRLQQSGYAVWRYYAGDPMSWQGATRVPLPDERSARLMADRLHRCAGGDPLIARWSSLRDALGLRGATWFDASWLSAGATPAAIYRAAGGLGALPAWSGLPATAQDPWPLVQQAVADATGLSPDDRGAKHVARQAAIRRGWTPLALARASDVQLPTIHRSLRMDVELQVQRTLIHLEDIRLRSALVQSNGSPRSGLSQVRSASPPLRSPAHGHLR